MKRLWILGAALLAAAPALGKTFAIDPARSKVSFRVQHMMVEYVTGDFGKFTGRVDYAPGRPKAWQVDADIDAGSIDTGIAARDSDLRSERFLDAAGHPSLVFKSLKVAAARGRRAKLIGDLTIRGITKRVTLNLDVDGVSKDAKSGAEILRATAETTIDRRDYGLVWNKAIEAGGVMIGDAVQIAIAIEAEASPAPA